MMQVLEHRSARAELNLSQSNSRLAIGAAIVQGIGILQSARTLMDELTKAHGSDADVLKNATLGVVDGAAGVTGSMMDLLAAQQTAKLIVRDTSGKLVQASTSIAAFKTVSALTNFLGAGIAVYFLMGSKMQAAKEGDQRASNFFGFSIYGLFGYAATSGYVAADVASKGAVSRAVGARLLPLLGRFAAAEAAAAAVAATVTGANLAMLLGGITFYFWAMFSRRSDLQRWAGRCYFGGDAANRHKSDLQEGIDLSIIIDLNEYSSERKRLASHAAPRTLIDPPGNPMGDGWGGGSQ